MSKKSSSFMEQESRYGAHNYHPLPVVLSRGEGVYLYDVDGKRYLDMMSAYSAVSHGHSHPVLIRAAKAQLDRLCITSRAFYTDRLGDLLHKLCEISSLDIALPMNTGAEAVETAIKAARRWAYEVKHIPDNTADIIVAENNFHGRTTTIAGFSTDADYKKHFGPFTPGFVTVPFGDIQALEDAITPKTCAFLVEPIQGEAGIIVPPEGWLSQVRKLCTKHNVLLIVDEIQSGLGRTGKMFAFEHEIEEDGPDILIVGKALGGGIMPISAVMGTQEVMELFVPGSHGSTFGGNPLAGTVGYSALCLLEEEGLIDNSARLGEYFLQKLRAIDSPLIREVRGRGLWIGVDIDPEHVSARQVCEKLMERGILSKETHDTVVRLAPPLIIEQAQIDQTVAHLTDSLTELSPQETSG